MMSETGYFYQQQHPNNRFTPAYHGVEQNAKSRLFSYYANGNNFQPHTSASIHTERLLPSTYSTADRNSNNIQNILTAPQLLPPNSISQNLNSITHVTTGINKPPNEDGMVEPSEWATAELPGNMFDQMPSVQLFGPTSPTLSHPPQGTSPRSMVGPQGQKRPRGEKKAIPIDQKDIKYFERRKRNNQAAKKSRDARKAREDEVAIRASFLEKENAVLRAQTATLRDEANSLKQLLLQKTTMYRTQ